MKQKNFIFPDVEKINNEIVAVGGDLSPDRILQAYRSGIFPWFEEDSLLLKKHGNVDSIFLTEPKKMKNFSGNSLLQFCYRTKDCHNSGFAAVSVKHSILIFVFLSLASNTNPSLPTPNFGWLILMASWDKNDEDKFFMCNSLENK